MVNPSILAAQNCGCPIIQEGPSLVNSPVCSGNFLFMTLLQAYLWGRCNISTPCKRIESVDETNEDYDFIVVGAGSAGSIVAGRLVENTTYKVLLLEAGGPEPIGGRIPGFYRSFWGNEEVDWRIRTVPDDYCLDQDGQGCQWPLGKGLGMVVTVLWITILWKIVTFFYGAVPYRNRAVYKGHNRRRNWGYVIARTIRPKEVARSVACAPSWDDVRSWNRPHLVMGPARHGGLIPGGMWRMYKYLPGPRLMVVVRTESIGVLHNPPFPQEYALGFPLLTEGFLVNQFDTARCRKCSPKLGGTSQLNGMMYHRGHAADFDDWVAEGAEGWSWDEVRPFMDMAEGNKQVGSLVSAEHHSESGKMPIQRFRYQPPALHDLIEAINQTGFPIFTDMNDPDTPDGFGIAQAFNDHGQRYTTARAYLPPKSEQPNLDVKLYAHVTKVLFDGARAYGVEYVDNKGNTKTANATKEVILSAGSLTSPKILMHSGVGPKEVLEPLGIPVLADLPVGKSLKNHCGATLYFMLTAVNNTEALNWYALVEFLLTNKGPMTSTGLTQLTGLQYSSYANKSLKQPDLQFFFNGLYAECSKTGVMGEPAGDCPSSGYNVSANAVALLPRSTGWMTINSTDPLEQALYYPNFFAHPDDMEIIKEGLQILRQIFNSDILQNKYKVELDPEYTEVCDKIAEAWSDEWMECMIRVHTDPQNHQLATCAIGKVIDPQLRVYNLTDIRVCDAGSMPSQPTGNPQGAIMAVAERCAHLIKERWQ